MFSPGLVSSTTGMQDTLAKVSFFKASGMVVDAGMVMMVEVVPVCHFDRNSDGVSANNSRYKFLPPITLPIFLREDGEQEKVEEEMKKKKKKKR